MGSPTDNGIPWNKPKEQIHQDVSASHLTQLFSFWDKTHENQWGEQKASRLDQLAREDGDRNWLLFTEMCTKYVPCLQVQFATESLISFPQQQETF